MKPAAGFSAKIRAYYAKNAERFLAPVKLDPSVGEDKRLTLDLPDIAEVWRRKCVISSWLVDLGVAA